MPGKSSTILSLVTSGMLLTLAATAQAADVTYDFSGTCTDCSGFGIGELTLSNYNLGDSITPDNFVSLHYDGTNLLAAFEIDQGNNVSLYGQINGPLPAAETVSVYNQSTGQSFYASSGGYWCVGTSCISDYGSSNVWSAAAPITPVPEPFALWLFASGVIGTAWAIRRRATTEG